MSPADSLFAQLSAPGPHPATAELRAYAAGTFGPAEQFRIEAPLLDCQRCTDLVDGFALTDATTTDEAVAGLRIRLQARIGTAEPVVGATRWVWPRVVAAAALLGVVGGGLWGWEQQRDTPSPVATARLETTTKAAANTATDVVADALNPEPNPSASTVSPSASEAAIATVPNATEEAAGEAAKKADYAAVSPAQSGRISAPGPLRRVRPTTSPTRVVVTDQAVSADISDTSWGESGKAQAEAQDNMVLSEAVTNAAPLGANTVAEVAPAKKSKSLAHEKTVVADTAAYAQVAAVRRLAKVEDGRFAPSNAPVANKSAAAMVAATPMPAAPAIAPAPVGGTMALREYLRREAVDFDPEINNLRLTGTVRVRFVVGADGKISNFKVVRGLRADYDAEALRIVREGPAWQPGIAGGHRAPLLMEVGVPF